MSRSFSPTTAPSPLTLYARRARRIGIDQPFLWVIGAWHDLRTAPVVCLGYGAIFVVGGLALTRAAVATDTTYLLGPLISGFMLMGPLFGVGVAAIAADLEAGRKPTLLRALTAWRANAEEILWGGLALMLLFLAWVRVSQLLFALCLPDAMASGVAALVQEMLFTPQGRVFSLAWVALGGAAATLAFIGGAFSMQLMFDRGLGLVEAVQLSAAAVWLNPAPMLLWAGMLFAATMAGITISYVGLAVAMPLAGLGSWRAYRATLRPEGPMGSRNVRS